MIKGIQYENLKKRFFNGVNSVFERNSDNVKCIPELLTLYNRLMVKFPGAEKNYENLLEIVEDLLYYCDTRSKDNLKKQYGVEFDQIQRGRIVEIIYHLKNQNPFSSTSSKFNGLLMQINQAFELNNSPMGKSSLLQLSEDINLIENNLRSKEKDNLRSYIISIVGTILTIIFGVVSLIPLLKK